MEIMKYKMIKSEIQYKSYCNQLESLLLVKDKSGMINEEIELLTLLIEKWEHDHTTTRFSDPVELLDFLMTENKLKAVDLAVILNVSKGLVSDILNYKKGFSKIVIRKLSIYFKVSQEAFNRSYPLKNYAGDMNRKVKSIA
jgi:HTH-type transcriptional regulator / antitoxin HigA